MPVVTISRLLGTTGDAIARDVAMALEARLVNQATLHAAAQAAGISPAALEEIESAGARGLVNRVLDTVRHMPSLPHSRGGSMLDAAPLALPYEGTLATLGPARVEIDRGVRILERVVRRLASEGGNVVVVGRAGHAILRDHKEALHVQIVAPLLARVEAVASAEGVDKRVALDRVRASDRFRADFVRRYYNVGWCEPWNYDLVLNSAHMGVKDAVAIILRGVEARRVRDA